MEALVIGIMMDLGFFARFLYKKSISIKLKELQMAMAININTLLSLFMDTKGIIMFAV